MSSEPKLTHNQHQYCLLRHLAVQQDLASQPMNQAAARSIKRHQPSAGTSIVFRALSRVLCVVPLLLAEAWTAESVARNYLLSTNLGSESEAKTTDLWLRCDETYKVDFTALLVETEQDSIRIEDTWRFAFKSSPESQTVIKSRSPYRFLEFKRELFEERKAFLERQHSL